MRLLILAIPIALMIAVSVAAVFVSLPLDVDRIHADITLDESHRAFKLTNDSFMHFGTIGLDNSATRAITIQNIRSQAITATVYIDGPEWLTVSENKLRLEPDEVREVIFTAEPFDDEEYGHYEWNITVVYRRW
ncbi:MAG: hypothetical protein ACMXYM_04075 [Candidatus Woesearchaeota archaeon]